MDFWNDADAAVAGLGTSLGDFSTDLLHLVKRLLLAAALLFVAVALLLLGIALEVLGAGGLAHHLLVVGLFPLAASIRILGRALSARGRTVQVHAEGLLEARRGQVTVLRWEDVNRVVLLPGSRAWPMLPPPSLELIGRDGRRLVFHEGLAGLEELTRLAQEQTMPWMLPPAWKAFQEDALIGFGAVSVGREGLFHDANLCRWEMLEEAKVVGPHLVVKTSSREVYPWQVPLARVPNVHVLLALAERATRRS